MNQPTLRIDELRLRVPGLNREEAGRLAEQVAKELAAQLPASVRPGQFSSLQVRVKPREGEPGNRLPATIAGNIARRLA